MNKPKVKCLICKKECDGDDCEDANLHKIKTGHNRFELIMRDTCAECGVELYHPEHKFCSLCVASKEHIADLGWEFVE